MRKTSPHKIGMLLFIMSITLLLLAILTACVNADNKTDVSSDKENASKETISKDEKFAQLENEFNVQLGVYAMDTGTNQTVEYRPEERFAYSSTFKPLAAAILLEQNNIEDLEKKSLRIPKMIWLLILRLLKNM